ncbi:MAG: exodeoxyribonuclease VII large subunit [Sphingomonadales bacterium]
MTMLNQPTAPRTGAAPNVREYSVSELSFALKRAVEDGFGYVRVRGEISGFKRAASGHMYMALKDEKSVLDAVCWRGAGAKLRFRPEDGLEVVCTGKLTTYPARSKYQLVIESMEPAGEGALMALLEERKRKLAAEGLFLPERKKPIPYLPEVIGIVTSPTGAVIRDILHRLADRFPRRVLLWPALVQGDGAAAQIAQAIEGFNGLEPGAAIPRPDLLIVARGGGSLEDLWAFNEEIVVRAAAASDIPLISAIGHETDTTLIDFASDKRAPTPTAAAEMAVPVRSELADMAYDLDRRLTRAIDRRIDERRERVAGLARGLPSPRDLLALGGQRLDDLAERLPLGLSATVAVHRQRFASATAGLHPSVLRQTLKAAYYPVAEFARRLTPAIERLLTMLRLDLGATARLVDSLSHEGVLRRGFALVRDPAGRPVKSAAATRPGDRLDIEFHDGTVATQVTGSGGKKASRTPAKASGDQGSLF